MSVPLRSSGIPPLGDVAWGTHICHFFETTEDLCDTVVPYLLAGLEQGELCFWLLSDLTEADCTNALRSRCGPKIEPYLAGGAIVLQDAAEWYRSGGVFEVGAMLRAWTAMIADVRQRGFQGIRVAGCESWLELSERKDFARYEAELDRAIRDKPVIVLCSYPLSSTGAAGVLDVAEMHDFALAKREGKWERLETPAVRMRHLSIRGRQQTAIATLGLSAIRGHDLDRLFAEAASLATETLGDVRCIVWQLRLEQNDLLMRAHSGWPELPDGATIPLQEGTPAYYSFVHDRAVVVVDVANDPRFQQLSWVLRDYGVVTLLSALIRGRKQPWGAISVHSMSKRAFDDADVEFLQSVANVLALAIERNDHELARVRLLESERAARETAEAALAKLHAIESITDTALGRMGLDDLLTELLARLRNVLETDHAAVMLVDEQHSGLSIRAADGWPISRAAGLRVPLDGPIIGQVMSTGEGAIVNDTEFPHLAVDLTGSSIRSGMGAPLIASEKIIGIVAVTSITGRHYTEDELDLLRVVAVRAAPAIERGRLLEDVRAAHERLESLSRRLLSVQEEERRRVAIELHDELGQILTAVKINLGSSPAQLEDAMANVDEAMQTVRDLALELRPPMLDDLGLSAALRWYADRFAQQASLETHLAIPERVPDLDPNVATACFRVAQEALTNVVRHSGARNVWIKLTHSPAELLLTVRDDGAGFDADAARRRAVRGASVGLIGMEERVSLAGGVLEIFSVPGQGTQVSARFPTGPAA